ncbi:hypothetical protein ACFV4Q_23980 [Streptomyces nojiriensis]|uniref:hypothetical protein n=1 Tax=Streptomyces nojiriensis TaxID=66374 RepID=UPI00365C858C
MGCAREYGREALPGPLPEGLNVPLDLELDLGDGRDSSWKQTSGTALVGRLVDAPLHCPTGPPSGPPAAAAGL